MGQQTAFHGMWMTWSSATRMAHGKTRHLLRTNTRIPYLPIQNLQQSETKFNIQIMVGQKSIYIICNLNNFYHGQLNILNILSLNIIKCIITWRDYLQQIQSLSNHFRKKIRFKWTVPRPRDPGLRLRRPTALAAAAAEVLRRDRRRRRRQPRWPFRGDATLVVDRSWNMIDRGMFVPFFLFFVSKVKKHSQKKVCWIILHFYIWRNWYFLDQHKWNFVNFWSNMFVSKFGLDETSFDHLIEWRGLSYEYIAVLQKNIQIISCVLSLLSSQITSNHICLVVHACTMNIQQVYSWRLFKTQMNMDTMNNIMMELSGCEWCLFINRI